MADRFAACNVAWPGLTVPWAAVGHHLGDEIFICCPPPPPARPEPGRRRTVAVLFRSNRVGVHGSVGLTSSPHTDERAVSVHTPRRTRAECHQAANRSGGARPILRAGQSASPVTAVSSPSKSLPHGPHALSCAAMPGYRCSAGPPAATRST